MKAALKVTCVSMAEGQGSPALATWSIHAAYVAHDLTLVTWQKQTALANQKVKAMSSTNAKKPSPPVAAPSRIIRSFSQRALVSPPVGSLRVVAACMSRATWL